MSDLIYMRQGLHPVVVETLRRIKRLPEGTLLYLLAGAFDVNAARELDTILYDSQWTPPALENGVRI